MEIKKLIGAAENIAYEKPMLLSLTDCTDIVFAGGSSIELRATEARSGGDFHFGDEQDDGEDEEQGDD